LFPFDLDQRDRLAGSVVAIGGDRGHRRAVEGRLGLQHVRLLGPDGGEVAREERLATCTLGTILSRRGTADDLARALGPLVERVVVALDHDPLLGVPALDFLLGPDQSRHVSTASSIRGYAPQRQRLPAIAWRTRSGVGFGSASTSAAAETICPGVQK